MRRVGMVFVLVIGALATLVTLAAAHERVAILDDCDPSDPAWDPTGGCTLKKGDVTLEEFNDLLTSPLSLATIGHPAWRNAPTYLKIKPDKTVKVTNRGGRLHTFTEVAAFGGGRVPPLNVGLTPAPECITPDVVGPTELPPGAHLKVDGLDVGDHLFQCCIHPWMRTLITVKEPEEG
jgi:plastocyanin